MSDYITVKAPLIKKPDGGFEMILFETHPAHPNGEIFIAADGGEYEVGDTPAVQLRLANKRLLPASSVTKRTSDSDDSEPLRKATPDEAANAGLSPAEAQTATVLPRRETRR